MLAACGPQTDAERYAWALTQARSYERARSACVGIVAPHARGDCLVAAMERFGTLDAEECRAVQQAEPSMSLWRDECMFQLAERQRARGNVDGALQLCLDTRFSRECAWHLVQDEAEASLSEDPTLAELRLARFDGAQRIPDAPLQFWTIRYRTQAAAGETPDEATCLELSNPGPCHEALRRHVRLVLDARLRSDPDMPCRPAAEQAATVSTGAAWVHGPVAAGAVLDWQHRHCGPTQEPQDR